MAETLTESFCERCGSRYTFEVAPPRRRNIRRIRTLSRGFRNFVSNDDASFAEAMAAAREEDARSLSAQQLDAFYQAFNFCLNCRQYTCRNCWNSRVGECFSCAPDPELEAQQAAAALAHTELVSEAPTPAVPETANPTMAASAWPLTDLRAAREARAREAAAREPAATEAAAPEAAASASQPWVVPIDAMPADAMTPGPELELTPDEQAAIESALARHASRLDVIPKAAPTTVEDATAGEMVATARPVLETPKNLAKPRTTAEPVGDGRVETSRLLERFRPRRPTPVARPLPPRRPADEALPIARAAEATLAERAGIEPEVAAEPTPARAITPMDEAATPQEPLPAEAEREPVAAAEPVAESGATKPAEPTPPTRPAPPRTDVGEQPTWRIMAPDAIPSAEPPEPPAWPVPGAKGSAAEEPILSAPWAARVARGRFLESPVWDASSRDVLAVATPGAAVPVGIQACKSCGLSLSANARFCRRCGTPQG